MSGFINNILARHLQPEANIIPRLPGKFEPANSQVINTTENFTHEAVTDNLSSTVIKSEFNEPGNGYRQMNSFGNIASVPLSGQHIKSYSNGDSAPGQPDVQQPEKAELVSEGRNTIQPSNIEKIIPVNIPVIGSRQPDGTVSAENFQKKEPSLPVTAKPFPETVNPVPVKTINDPALNKDSSIPGTAVPGLMNDSIGEPVIQTEKVDLLNQHILMLRQKMKQKIPEKNKQVPEIFKPSNGHLIQPVINAKPVVNNTAAPEGLGDQIVNPVIKISIGRIEVRAVTATSPVKLSRNSVPKPNLTLDDYLKKRNGAEK